MTHTRFVDALKLSYPIALGLLALGCGASPARGATAATAMDSAASAPVEGGDIAKPAELACIDGQAWAWAAEQFERSGARTNEAQVGGVYQSARERYDAGDLQDSVSRHWLLTFEAATNQFTPYAANLLLDALNQLAQQGPECRAALGEVVDKVWDRICGPGGVDPSACEGSLHHLRERR